MSKWIATKPRATNAAGLPTISTADAEARYAAKKAESGYETPRELKARLIREEQEEKDRKDPVKIAERTANAKTLELRDELRKYWSGSLDTIAKTYLNTPRDPMLEVPETTSSFTMEQLKEAFYKWFDASGVTLSEDGGQRLVLFGTAQAKAGLDFSRPESWDVAFLHLNNVLQAFASGEVTVELEPEPEPQPALESRDYVLPDNSEEREVLAGIYAEARPIWQEWTAWLSTTYNIRLSLAEQKFILNELIPANNWNYADKRTYDKVRFYMVRTHKWSWDALSPQEKLDWATNAEIENTKTPLSRLNSVEQARLLGVTKAERLRVMGRT